MTMIFFSESLELHLLPQTGQATAACLQHPLHYSTVLRIAGQAGQSVLGQLGPGSVCVPTQHH